MKDLLPIDFITDFISKGWNEVGNLKANADAIKDEFKETAKVTTILENLVDAYLIAIGQMEALLDKKNYLDLPMETELKEDLSAENVELNNTEVPNVENKIEVKEETKAELDLPEYTVEIAQEDDNIKIELQPKEEEFLEDPNINDIIDEPKQPRDNTPFEYFVDFEDPDFSIEDDFESRYKEWID